jgi:hypothetical protein
LTIQYFQDFYFYGISDAFNSDRINYPTRTMAYAIFNGSNPDRPTRVISPVFADFESAHREAGHCGQWHYVGKATAVAQDLIADS